MMTHKKITALVAEDEPLLREELIHMLNIAWPDLNIVACVRNGRDAIAQFDLLKPDICFLDVHMPAFSGIDVARHIGNQAHIVFITAFDHYAVQAFERGAVDYLIKPIAMDRLQNTVARLQHQLASLVSNEHLQHIENLLAQLSNQSKEQAKTHQTINSSRHLKWIRAQVGQVLKFIAVDQIDFLKADEKYTLVGWHNESHQAVEDLIRTPLKELILQLDEKQFIQVHRAAVVNLHSIKHVIRGDNETATIYLKGHHHTLPVSRTYLHHFKQM